MVVGALGSRTELAIIGSGPGGYVAALRAADAGLEVTLIDRDQLGGTCLNVGCIPSKTLIEIANTRHQALQAAGFGLDATVDVRVKALIQHLETVSFKLRSGVGALLRDAGVTVITGNASFVRYDRLSIESDDQVSHLEFDNVIIATGSRPIELPNLPFGGRVVSSTGALQLTELPRTMTVVGGGYIGVELGTAWAKLGVRVTIVEAAESILPDVPQQLRQPVERNLIDLGIELKLGTRAEREVADGVLLSTGTEHQADIIVIAVGRKPNSDQASLDTLSVELEDSGHIVVDTQMRATSGVYAIGDIVAGPALAHKASAEAEVAVDAILRRPARFDPAALPAVIFSDPEIMMVGVSLDEAASGSLAIHRFPHSASARAHTINGDRGATYVVSDEAGTVVGVHAVGPHVSELTGEAALAIEMAATVEDLSITIHAHPTMAESISEAAWLARGMPLHIRR